MKTEKLGNTRVAGYTNVAVQIEQGELRRTFGGNIDSYMDILGVDIPRLAGVEPAELEKYAEIKRENGDIVEILFTAEKIVPQKMAKLLKIEKEDAKREKERIETIEANNFRLRKEVDALLPIKKKYDALPLQKIQAYLDQEAAREEEAQKKELEEKRAAILAHGGTETRGEDIKEYEYTQVGYDEMREVGISAENARFFTGFSVYSKKSKFEEEQEYGIVVDFNGREFRIC
jgi:hypothetical protein